VQVKKEENSKNEKKEEKEERIEYLNLLKMKSHRHLIGSDKIKFS